jgi:precorrin-6B methylase 2
MSILAARALAQQLAFGPMVFQALRVAWKRGVLAAIDEAGDEGISVEDLATGVGLSHYALDVLLEVAESADVVTESEGKFQLTKTGRILLYDRLTQVNFDFVHDVCYQGMFHLDEALVSGRPAGLRVFADAETIYECITDLPDDVRRSWYAFDHYYSDRSFKEAVKIVFRTPVAQLMDIGGNTGRWAFCCLEQDPEVEVTIVDLPGQLAAAREHLAKTRHARRVSLVEADVLAADGQLPGSFDVVWMSQFLDCFSEAQISQILARAKTALAPEGRLFIMETFVDRQRFDAARYSLNAISLYFTALANGNSRMYRGETMTQLLHANGYEVIATHDDLGIGHTLLECGLR